VRDGRKESLMLEKSDSRGACIVVVWVVVLIANVELKVGLA